MNSSCYIVTPRWILLKWLEFFVSDVGNAIECYDCYYKADGGDSENCLNVDNTTKLSNCDEKNRDDLDACLVRV